MIELGNSKRPANIIGYERLSSLGSATALTVPTGATAVLLQAETQNVRITGEGTTPTSTVGALIVAGGEGLLVTGDIAKVKAIQTASSAALSATYLSY